MPAHQSLFGELTPLAAALDQGAPVLQAAGMVPARLLLSGMAFFPVGRGLTQPGDWNISDKPVMILGQDFGTEVYVSALNQAGRENYVNSQTWRELRDLLPASGIPLEACFFTNVFMGLRAMGPMVGALPAAKIPAYRDWCAGFLRLQLSRQKPALVVVLGMEPLRFFGQVLGVDAWRGKLSYQALQDAGQLVQNVNTPEGTARAVVIPHPSFLHANQGRCAWRGATGRHALEAMLAETFRSAVPC